MWPTHTFVDFEHGLNAAMGRLRRSLNDSAASPRFIETLPRRGYRFIGTIEIDRHPGRRAQSTVAPHGRPRTPGAGSVGVRVRPRRSSRVRYLAILPFESVSKDPTTQYLADGITETLAGFVSIIGRLRVVAHASALKYRTSTKTPQEIARELMVSGLIRGTIDVSETGLRVTVALKVVGTGGAIGLVLAGMSGRLIETLLLGVRPLDPATFILVTLVLGITATLSIAAPAWRAARIDPAAALRNR